MEYLDEVIQIFKEADAPIVGKPKVITLDNPAVTNFLSLIQIDKFNGEINAKVNPNA